MNTLTIKRFNGSEIYKINKALLKFLEEDNHKYLKIKVDTSEAIQTLADTKGLKALPRAEILIRVNSFDKDLLQDASFYLKESYDKDAGAYLSSLYYAEHQDLNNNEVKVSIDSNDIYKIHWTASTCDVCYYEGSKPSCLIDIEAESLLSWD